MIIIGAFSFALDDLNVRNVITLENILTFISGDLKL